MNVRLLMAGTGASCGTQVGSRPGAGGGRRPDEESYGLVRIGNGVALTWAEGPRALVDQTLK